MNLWPKLYVTSLFAFSILVFGCGEDLFSGDEESSSSEPTSYDGDNDYNLPDQGFVDFKGYVVSAFDLQVDGESYLDMEDFYTKEVSQLPDKVFKAGYDSSYEVSFEADIGFSDLWKDMTVTISTVNDRGYQGMSRVNSNGEFRINLPSDAIEDEYKIRANKRISVVLRRADEIIKICYNFSAMDTSAFLSESDKPVILSKFSTSLTKYECSAVSPTGIWIPSSEKQGSLRLAPGMSKNDVLAILGDDLMHVQSDVIWCWQHSYNSEKNVCSVAYGEPCNCSISFNEKGVVEGQENIKAEFLDVLKW